MVSCVGFFGSSVLANILANELSSEVQQLISVDLHERVKGLKFSISTLYAFYAFLYYILTVEYGMTWERYDKNSKTITSEEVACSGGGWWASLMLHIQEQY